MSGENVYRVFVLKTAVLKTILPVLVSWALLGSTVTSDRRVSGRDSRLSGLRFYAIVSTSDQSLVPALAIIDSGDIPVRTTFAKQNQSGRSAT